METRQQILCWFLFYRCLWCIAHQDKSHITNIQAWKTISQTTIFHQSTITARHLRLTHFDSGKFYFRYLFVFSFISLITSFSGLFGKKNDGVPIWISSHIWHLTTKIVANTMSFSNFEHKLHIKSIHCTHPSWPHENIIHHNSTSVSYRIYFWNWNRKKNVQKQPKSMFFSFARWYSCSMKRAKKKKKRFWGTISKAVDCIRRRFHFCHPCQFSSQLIELMKNCFPFGWCRQQFSKCQHKRR